MQHCPPIILNKIYWYLWRHLQYKLCIEYHKYYSYDMYSLVYGCRFSTRINDRLINQNSGYRPIWTFSPSWSVLNIYPPHYYFYSNGDRHNIYL